MPIRPAALSDAPALNRLLTQLEYPGTQDFLEIRLTAMLQDPAEILLVWEELANQPAPYPDPSPSPANQFSPSPHPAGPPRILGLLSLHFIPQLALQGDFARISYFAVDDDTRSKGIGRELEEEAARLARKHGCTLIEVHCHSRRTRAHAFYARQGYTESPKYLIKKL